MSQFVLDEQLDHDTVLAPLQNWVSAERLTALRPGEHILDDRVPALLRALRRPTFLSIDSYFWRAAQCDPRYCILYFALRRDQQPLLPGLLRALLLLPGFRTRAARMGKVARISTRTIEYRSFRAQGVQRLTWSGPRRSKR